MHSRARYRLIDIATEKLISLTEASGKLPSRRGGSKPHVATLYRWASRGVRGIVLETCMIGGTRATSVEALQRFVNRLSGRASAMPPLSSSGSTSHQQAEQELDRAGW